MVVAAFVLCRTGAQRPQEPDALSLAQSGAPMTGPLSVSRIAPTADHDALAAMDMSYETTITQCRK